MKKFLSIKTLSLVTLTVIFAIMMTSCKSGIAPQPVASYDTVGLAAFQQWKFEQYQAAMSAPVAVTPVTHTAVAKKKRVTSKSTGNYGSGSMSNTSTHTAETAPIVKKKGMSKAAKGAIIGGAGGAVLGAVINKRNRVAGGIIGGVLGGGVGYGIGRSQDKKDGRY